MFNKKFDGKYTGVRRPIICNGLKEIKAYKLEVVEHKTPADLPVEDSQEPAPSPEHLEPEPEPELEP